MHEAATPAWIRGSLLLTAVVALVGIAGCRYESEEGSSTPPPPPSLDELPPVEQVLEQMAEFLASQQEFSFRAFVTYEAVQDDGQKLSFDVVNSVSVGKPDRMFWVTIHDDGSVDSVWFADGVLSVVKRPDDVYGQVETPMDIAGMIDVADAYALVVPFGDILRGDAAEFFLDEVESAINVGQAWVGGEWTDHIAVRQPDVDVELWVRSVGEPVPVKLKVIYKLADGAPTFSARIRDYDFAPRFDASTFQFVAPPDADRVQVAPVR